MDNEDGIVDVPEHIAGPLLEALERQRCLMILVAVAPTCAVAYSLN